MSTTHEDQLRKIEDLLRHHDWYYHMADDHTVWHKGNREYHTLLAWLNVISLKEAKELWAKYAPKEFGFPIRKENVHVSRQEN